MLLVTLHCFDKVPKKTAEKEEKKLILASGSRDFIPGHLDSMFLGTEKLEYQVKQHVVKQSNLRHGC